MTLDAEKKILLTEFQEYLTKWKERIVTISPGKAIVLNNDPDGRLNKQYPPVSVFKGDPEDNGSVIVLAENYVKPAYLSQSDYKTALTRIKIGDTLDGDKVPGFDAYYKAMSQARNAGYKAIFHRYGASQYIKTTDEYEAYIGELRDSLGESEVEDLFSDGYLTRPKDYKTPQLTNPADPGWKYERKTQIEYIAKMLYYRKEALNIFKVLQSYRHIPSGTAAQKAKDKTHNKEVMKIYKSLQAEAKTEYGIPDSSNTTSGWTASTNIIGRYNESLFMTAIDVLYSYEREMVELDPSYPRGINGDFFKDLIEGDNELRRVRALDHILDGDGNLKSGLNEKLWGIVLKNYNKFIEKAEKGIKANVEVPVLDENKKPIYEFGIPITKLELKDLSKEEYIDMVLGYTNPDSFKMAISNMYPNFKVYRTETGGRVVPFFTWIPSSLNIQRIYILMTYGETDPGKANDLISRSAKSPVTSGSKPEEKEGFFRKIFGERQGFKSSEVPTSLKAKDAESTEAYLNNQSTNAKIENEKKSKEKSNVALSGINSPAESEKESDSKSNQESAATLMGANKDDLKPGSSSVTNNTTNINNETNLSETEINKMVDNAIMKGLISGELFGSDGSINNAAISKLIQSEASSFNLENNLIASKSESSVNAVNSQSSLGGTSSKSENFNVTNVSKPSSVTSKNQSSGAGGSSTSINNLSNLSNSGSKSDNISNTSSVSNISKETVAQSINVEKRGSSLSNLSNNSNTSTSTVENKAGSGLDVSGEEVSTVNNINNQSGGNQTSESVTNNTNNDLSKTPVIQNNIDLSEMNLRLKRIEEALMSPLEVKVVSNIG